MWRTGPLPNGTVSYTRLVSASRVHLIRHGEVENPHHVVYADLPGYGLSPLGMDQARATSAHLAAAPVAMVMSSPLLRALQTANEIAACHGLGVQIDESLTEWAVGTRWAGVRWEDLDEVFPGELTAYLQHPHDMPFASETLAQCGSRVAEAILAAAGRIDGDLVVVSHQDPIHAGHLHLTAESPDHYHADKPTHASIVTLQPAAEAWLQISYWEPEQGERFPPVE